jgi:hypothetical protein
MSTHLREHPLPRFGDAVVITDAARCSLRSMKARGTSLEGFNRGLFSKPPLERASVVVELVSHVAELRYGWVILMDQRVCYLSAEISLRSEIARQDLHAAYVPKLASKASHKVVYQPSPKLRLTQRRPHRS